MSASVTTSTVLFPSGKNTAAKYVSAIPAKEKLPDAVAADLFAFASRYHLERAAPMSTFAAVLSNLVSNVPAVLVFKGFVSQLPNPVHGWLTLAMSSTLAGKECHGVRLKILDRNALNSPALGMELAAAMLRLYPISRQQTSGRN